MLRYPIDYFMIIVVGFGIGFASLFVIQPLAPSPDIGTFEELSETAAEDEVDLVTSISKRKRASKANLAWFNDMSFIEELEYLMEANCSDHAMRQYGRVLAGLDTSGFDPETGRLIDGEGNVVNYFLMRKLVTGLLPLQPLAYMKDEFIPENFRPIMKNVRRKENWKTCKFKMPAFLKGAAD